jgi:hypothetical protein
MTHSTNKYEKAVYAAVILSAVLLYFLADSPFVERLNKITTSLLAILTAGYVLLTYWILRSTRQSIQEQTRPYVVASLPLDGFQIMLTLRNFGNRPAHNVKVRFDPSLDTIGGDFPLRDAAESSLTQSFMAPSFEIRNPIALAPQVINLDSSQTMFHVFVEYSDSQGVKYSDEYEINLNSYVHGKGVIQHDAKHYLKSISESMKSISEYVKTLK